jgi:hypothetical protein
MFIRSITFIFCVLHFSVAAQILIPETQDTVTYNHEFKLNSNVDYFSSSIPIGMSKKFFQGGNIDATTIQSSYDQHKAVNIFGILLNGELEYRTAKISVDKKEQWGLLFKAGAYSYAGLSYSKDLFGTVFQGTKQYIGKNADYTGSNFDAGSFFKIGAGVFHKVTKSSINLNIVSMSSYVSAYMREAKLLQNADSTNLNLIVDGSYTQKLKSNVNPSMGLSIDIDIRLPVEWGKNNRRAWVQLYASNIGFASAAITNQYQVDSSYNFNGLTFNQLLDTTLFKKDAQGWLDSLGVEKTRKSKVLALPALIQFGKIIDANSSQKVQLFCGIRIMPTISFIPNVFAGLHWKPIKKWSTGIQASYGGFGGYRTGWYSNLHLKKCTIGAGTENMLALFSKKAHGESFVIRATLKL